MKTGLAAAVAVLWWTSVPSSSAHRLDELLQATTIALSPDRVVAQLRLTPGIAVARAVIAEIDADGDGLLSEKEQRAYAERVLRDLSLTVDRRRLPLRVVSAVFPTVEEMQGGMGEILLRFEADAPRGGPDHRLIFENHYQGRLAAYLVNCLRSDELHLRINAQKRSDEQSFFQLDYTLPDVRPNVLTAAPDASTSGRGGLRGRRSLVMTAFPGGIARLFMGQARWPLVLASGLALAILWGLVRSLLRARRSISSP